MGTIDSQSLVVVGLGNPGSKYDGTRHNLGFAVVDALLACARLTSVEDIAKEAHRAAADSLSGRFDAVGWNNRGNLLEAPLSMCGVRGFLLKPRTFMNLSGEPLRDFLAFRKIQLHHVVVVHDEIDLPGGALWVKVGGGEGGHNGLRSIAQSCGGRDFARVRVGVGKPPVGHPGFTGEDGIARWVLARYAADELAIVQELVGRAAAAVVSLALDGLAVTQNRYNR